MRTVGIGIQSFEKIAEDRELFYVDKTGFIEEWYKKKDDITLITRPRRFGKTLTMDMLYCFFSLDYVGRQDLFEGLAISRDEAMMHLQGSMPALKISFSSLKSESFSGFLLALAGKAAAVLQRYRYLLDSTVLSDDEKEIYRDMCRPFPEIPSRDADEEKYLEYVYRLTHIFHILSGWLMRFHGKKVYIFMDEYDTPIQSAWMHGYYDSVMDVMRELFSETFKENEFLDRAVITGITRIAKESLFSEMNNLAISSVIHGGYDTAFGFTEGEVDSALSEFGIAARKAEVKDWYDGFSIGKVHGIYNPWSVINFLANRDRPPEDYWSQSGGTGVIDYLVKKGGDGLHRDFQTLLGGRPIVKDIREDLIFPRLTSDGRAVWSLLAAAGYLKPTARLEEGLQLAMVNREVSISLSEMVKGWFDTENGNDMTLFASALLRNDLAEMNRQLGRVVLTCTSVFDSGTKTSRARTKPENYFHGLTTGLLACLLGKYDLTSNGESGAGRYDLTLEPVDREKYRYAYILEFKVFDKAKGDAVVEDTARRAKEQILEMAYAAKLKSRGFDDEHICIYGVGFKGKKAVIV